MTEYSSQAEAVGRAVLVMATRSPREHHHHNPRTMACGLSAIASALATIRDRFPDDISSRSDVDACKRASQYGYMRGQDPQEESAEGLDTTLLGGWDSRLRKRY